MSPGLIIQYVIVGFIVVACTWVTMRKLLPKPTNRWLAAASIHFGRKHESRVARALSRRLQPKQATGSCADGCATCGACGPKKPPAARPAGDKRVPLHFRPISERDTEHSS